MLDSFKNAHNNILRDMWAKAQRYKLSDKQINFARKLWSQEQMPMVELGQEKADFLRKAAWDYLPSNYHNDTGSYIANLIYDKMEQYDYEKVITTFRKYRKSILNKVFK